MLRDLISRVRASKVASVFDAAQDDFDKLLDTDDGLAVSATFRVASSGATSTVEGHLIPISQLGFSSLIDGERIKKEFKFFGKASQFTTEPTEGDSLTVGSDKYQVIDFEMHQNAFIKIQLVRIQYTRKSAPGFRKGS